MLRTNLKLFLVTSSQNVMCNVNSGVCVCIHVILGHNSTNNGGLQCLACQFSLFKSCLIKERIYFISG